MMASRHKALLAEKNGEDLGSLLRQGNLDPVPVTNARELMRLAVSENPAVIIGDLAILGKPVGEICGMLKNHHLARHIPLIIVTENATLRDRINWVSSGAADCIVKPFEREEVLARIRGSIQHVKIALDANPLTRLPGNIGIREQMEQRLHQNETFIVAYVDIDNFKIYNDLYGYAAGDQVILKTASLMLETLESLELLEGMGFTGHVGGDDFIMMGPESTAEAFCERLINKFDRAVRRFYDPKILEQGYILGRDRKGNTATFPLLSLSIAVVVNSRGCKFKHAGEIAGAGAEIKAYLKRLPGSVYLVDRREVL